MAVKERAEGRCRTAKQLVKLSCVFVTVPKAGPGVIRVVRWTVKSNAVPVNLYEKRPR